MAVSIKLATHLAEPPAFLPALPRQMPQISCLNEGLLHRLDVRHDELLVRLDELNERIEQVLAAAVGTGNDRGEDARLRGIGRGPGQDGGAM